MNLRNLSLKGINGLRAARALGRIDAGDDIFDGDWVSYDHLIRNLSHHYDDGRSIEEMQHDEANETRRLD